jgi:environmental stress-induced protein Ves
MRILRADDHRRMPWKNGGGVTMEVAASPAGATLDDFDWRVSMARVERDGPFSAFPGVDRTLTLLSGEGLILSLEGRVPFGLTLDSEPFPFPADVPTQARLIAGPVTDLNVMTRRARLEHTVWRLAVPQTRIASDADTLMLVCARGSVGLEVDGWTDRLAPLDCLLWNGSTVPVCIEAEQHPVLFLIEINKVG